MTTTIEFGKRINKRPIIVSFLVSFLAGALGLLVNLNLGISLFLLCLFLLLFVYYPINLPKLFSHWQLEKHGISYYKMDNYLDKLKMIFLPQQADFQFISYSQIKAFSIQEEAQNYTLKNILTIKPAKQSPFPWLRKPFFLELELNHATTKLDLSYDQLHDPKNTMFKVSNALDFLSKHID
ncbi:hypothetical protein [Companilactobacillus sp. FL22-1]|uniref:hypothetical protein n=1 Tax=Companilactobacillus sp. FL22-1 TaxID=3373892 RepID=UPI0037546D94